MSIKEDYQQAVALTKQGKYVEARNLLIIHDHPKTNQLLERIEKAIATDAQTPKGKPDRGDAPNNFYTRLALSVVLTFAWFLPGLLCTIFFSKEARKHPKVPGASAMIWYNRILFGVLAFIVIGGILIGISVILTSY